MSSEQATPHAEITSDPIKPVPESEYGKFAQDCVKLARKFPSVEADVDTRIEECQESLKVSSIESMDSATEKLSQSLETLESMCKQFQNQKKAIEASSVLRENVNAVFNKNLRGSAKAQREVELAKLDALQEDQTTDCEESKSETE
ncbi:hypothetical protein K491DRAFT_722763 [Lophiostoma macrostomum CBS 122681]|uniref:Uncharacterized protein n=1 Tax=Lophiostoma macrostomum CBS 122681 TaxID=1314788 RepID=A0A6A6SNP6_9PLEO|nr:hypothetical protein K491DRAFT_722763 [Lophiostoma macrostomum CBS 122681]